MGDARRRRLVNEVLEIAKSQLREGETAEIKVAWHGNRVAAVVTTTTPRLKDAGLDELAVVNGPYGPRVFAHDKEGRAVDVTFEVLGELEYRRR